MWKKCSWKLVFLGRVVMLVVELDAGGALGHVCPICSRSEPPVFVPLIFKDLGLTFTPSKMVWLGQIHQVMTCVK